MDSNRIIMGMICICLGMMAFIMMAKPLKIIGKWCLNAALGAVGFYAANLLLQPFQISVGINLLTMGIVGILGIPGFAATILISAIL